MLLARQCTFSVLFANFFPTLMRISTNQLRQAQSAIGGFIFHPLDRTEAKLTSTQRFS
jgi:hypothetical protein